MSDASLLPHDDLGQGEALVLIHAFPFDRTMWQPQHPLSQRARLVLPDMAGFGRARALSPRASIDEMADDVARLLEHLMIEKASVAGLSMGGYVALSLMRRHPEKVARLALCDTRASADSPQALEGRRAALETLSQKGLGALVESMLPKLLSPRSPAEVVERVRSLGVSQPPATVEVAIGALRDRADQTELLGQITVPTTIIVGEDDAMTPPAEARSMAAAITGATVVEIEGAGHLSNLERPEAFNAALAALLDRR